MNPVSKRNVGNDQTFCPEERTENLKVLLVKSLTYSFKTLITYNRGTLRPPPDIPLQTSSRDVVFTRRSSRNVRRFVARTTGRLRPVTGGHLEVSKEG